MFRYRKLVLGDYWGGGGLLQHLRSALKPELALDSSLSA